MATIKVQYVVQSCPSCGKKLLKVAAGTTEIGSPLLVCKTCDKTYYTQMRQEWYAYEPKWMVFALPAIIAAAMMVVGVAMGEPVIGVMAAIIGLIIGLCISGGNIVRMIKSKRRMRDREYLQKLKEYGAIKDQDFERFMSEAK